MVWNKLNDSGKYNILVIYSFDKSYVWMDDFEEGMKDGFSKNRVSVNIKRYYWKSESNTDETLKLSSLSEWLDKFSTDRPDLIITCDDIAAFSLLKTEHPLSYQLPVVFCGVDYPNEDLLQSHTNVTGFTDNPDYLRCYELGRQIFGRISDITVITGDDPYTGQITLTDLRKQFSSLPNLVEIAERYPVYKVDTLAVERGAANPFRLHIEQIEQLKGSALKQVLFHRLNSMCILAKWDASYASIARLGTAPFLMANNEGFGDGRIGGYMTTGYDQMYNAATIASQILQGTSVQQFPITRSLQYPVFDWSQLQYWKIDINALPEDAIVLNIPFYIKYQQSLVAIGLIVGLFLLLFFSLLIRLYKRESYYKVVAQKKLRKEQRELDITMDALNEGVISFTGEGTILSINNAAVELLGLEKRKSYVGEAVWSLLDIQTISNPFYLKNIVQSFGNSVGKNEKLDDSAYLVTSQKKFPVSGNISSLGSDDKPCGVVVSFHDMTNEFTQKQFLALSMISGNLFAWKFDQEAKAFVFEKDFFDTYQLPDDGSHLIDSERFLLAIHPDDREEVRKGMNEIITGEAQQMSVTCRMQYTGQGDYQWWKSYVSVYPTAIADGQYKYYGVWVNIDEFKKREEELIFLRDEAEKSDQLKTVFLSNMSHEVRTPLNSIVGFSSILIDNQDLPWAERKEFIDIINENCRLLLNLINEILDISRIESGIYFREESCDLTAVAREAIAMNELARPETVTICLDVPDVPFIMTGDSFRLIQLYGHLLSNAYKFTKQGVVTVGYRTDETEACLVVKDTGIGIAETEKEKIFNRFYKSDEFIQGGGLGLSIVAEIVKRLNGRILLDSEVNKGTTFTICLPLRVAEELPEINQPRK